VDKLYYKSMVSAAMRHVSMSSSNEAAGASTQGNALMYTRCHSLALNLPTIKTTTLVDDGSHYGACLPSSIPPYWRGG